MVAPSRARRLPASRSIRARSPRCTNAVFSFSPLNLPASASNSSSMFNVVLIHIMMHVSYAHCKDFVSHVGFGAPTETIFPPFFVGQHGRWVRYPGLVGLRCGLRPNNFWPLPILALRDITRSLVSRIPPGFSAVFPRRVSGSADRCGADRTSDRAGEVQE